MYSQLSNKSPRDIIESIRSKLDASVFRVLAEALDVLWREILEIYRLFDDRPGGKKGGGGGGVTNTVPPVYVPVVIEYLTERLRPISLDENNSAVASLLWGGDDRALFDYHYNEVGGVITGMHGVIRFEGPDGLVYEHFVNMNLEFGSFDLMKDKLLGFSLGFERFDGDRGKFYVDVMEFEKTQQFLDTDHRMYTNISDKVSARKFRSNVSILTDEQLEHYTIGMRFACKLKLLTRV